MSNTIHISDVRTFRSCRRKWDWSSPLRGNLESITPYVPFYTGKAIHYALEVYYGLGVPFDESLDKYLTSEDYNMGQLEALWPAEEKSLVEQIELIRAILRHYQLWQESDRKRYRDENLEFIALETPFEVELVTPSGRRLPVPLAGRFDGIVRHRETGEYWIWETKTTRSIDELTRSLANDEQSTTYIYAARQLGNYPVVGVLYNMLRKKEPSTPGRISGGSLSKNRNIDTTSFHYLETIKRHFPDWRTDLIMQQYGDILAELEPNEMKYFMRFPIYRSEFELEMLLENLYDTAVEMLDPKISLYPAPSWLNCNFCSFRSPCLTMNSGGNYKALLEAEYQVKQNNTSMREE